MTVLAMLLAGLAAGLLMRPVPTSATLRADRPGPGLPRPAGPILAALVAAPAAALVVLLDGSSLALALILLGATVAAAQLWRVGRGRRQCEGRRAAVVEVSESLASELRTGQPVLAALRRAAEVWAPFSAVATAARLDADVPSALRRLAAVPGAEGLREVASAWQVSERSGATLSTALGQVAESARVRQSTDRLVRAELASAQATARLVAGLPFATLALSSGMGGDPWAFLLGHPAGLACLATGLLLVFAGLWWVERIATGVTRA